MAFDWESWEYVPENSDDGRAYRFDDLLEMCGDRRVAEIVAGLCEWQFPETVLDELEREGEVVRVREGLYRVSPDLE